MPEQVPDLNAQRNLDTQIAVHSVCKSFLEPKYSGPECSSEIGHGTFGSNSQLGDDLGLLMLELKAMSAQLSQRILAIDL